MRDVLISSNNIISVSECHCNCNRPGESTHLRIPYVYKSRLPGIQLLTNGAAITPYCGDPGIVYIPSAANA